MPKGKKTIIKEIKLLENDNSNQWKRVCNT